jgi:hypothetical protein
MGYSTVNSIDWVGSHWTATDGARSIDLSGDGIGGMQKPLPQLLISNTSLHFPWLEIRDGAPTTKQMLAFGA